MGDLARVALGAAGPEVHLVTINTWGRLWHAIRHGDATWTEFGDVEGQTGDMDKLVEVAVATIGGDLHVAAINDSRRLFHMIRYADGTWSDFGDVEGQTGDLGDMASVALAAAGQELHLVAANTSGRLWHAIRFADGSWKPEAQFQNFGTFIPTFATPVQLAAAVDADNLWVVTFDGSGSPTPLVRAGVRTGSGAPNLGKPGDWQTVGPMWNWAEDSFGMTQWVADKMMRGALAVDPASRATGTAGGGYFGGLYDRAHYNAFVNDAGQLWERQDKNEYEEVATKVGPLGVLVDVAMAVTS